MCGDMMYIGVDAHKESCQATVMDETGQIVEKEKILTREAL